MSKADHYQSLQNMYLAAPVKEVGRGSGVFVRSKMPLVGAKGYAD